MYLQCSAFVDIKVLLVPLKENPMTSLLNTIEPEKAEGKVKELYDHVTELWGGVPNAMKLHSVSPFLIEGQMAYIGYFMQRSTMSAKLQTLIRLLVSTDSDCSYCININTAMLLQEGMTLEEVNAIKKDPSLAPLEDNERGLLLHVLKATHTPKSIRKEDIAKLRDLQFSEQEIFEAVHYGANMVMVDILFDSFQVENEQM